MVPSDEDIDFNILGKRVETSWAKFLLSVGLGIVALLLVQTLIIALVAPHLVYPILRGVLTEMMTGREAGIAVFLEGGVPLVLTMQYSAMQDLATSFIVFPLFLFLLDRYHDRDNIAMRWVRRTQATAEKHERLVQRQGPVALFFFLLIPFMVNGPLVGLLIGRLVGIRMKVLVPIVVAATVVPAVAWSLFYNTLFAWAEEVMPAGPTYITLGVVVLVLLMIISGTIYDQIKERKNKSAGS